MEEEKREGGGVDPAPPQRPAAGEEAEEVKKEEEAGGREEPPRGKWANKREFLLCMAGEIIGLGNVWRFPYLCYKNGGGVFFIPYFIFLFFCGIPVFFLEAAVGQYTSQGGVTAWRAMCPMFQGIGYASQIILFFMNVYYIVVLAWAIFYLVQSFISPLPWSTCDNAWNSEMCHDRLGSYANPHLFQPEANWSFLHNSTLPMDYLYEDEGMSNYTTMELSNSPEEEFWVHRVLNMPSDSLGTINMELAACLLVAWLLCYFCVFKGIKSTGKVVYLTATFPYLLLVILFFRGVTLPGAWDGIKYYIYPDFSKLAQGSVWRDAGTQVFYSYAVCEGVIMALGSYNKYNNNCYRDCLGLCLLNSVTSIFGGFVVFSVIGFMSHELGISVPDLQASGPGLTFLTYPRAVSMLPCSNFWAVLFFLMILFLGLNSQFVCVESQATAIADLFPRQLRGRRELLVLAIAVVCFLLGLPFISEGGILLFGLVDTYGPSGISLLFIACFETTVIGWVYGADRFMDNIEDMIGYKPFPVIKYCWLFITPALCVVTILSEMQGQLLESSDLLRGHVWLVAAVLLVAVPMLCVPVCIGVSLCRDPQHMTTPSPSLRQARPQKPILTICGRVIFGPQDRRGPASKEETDAMTPV